MASVAEARHLTTCVDTRLATSVDILCNLSGGLGLRGWRRRAGEDKANERRETLEKKGSGLFAVLGGESQLLGGHQAHLALDEEVRREVP